MAVATSVRAGPEPRTSPESLGLGKAVELAQARLAGNGDSTAKMRDRLERALLQIESSGVHGADAPRVPQTSSMYFDAIDGESLVIALDLKGLAVSTGAACSSGAIEPSHVLTAMGITPDRARSSIRLSLGHQNTMEEVDLAIALVGETVARLRELSPAWGRVAVNT